MQKTLSSQDVNIRKFSQVSRHLIETAQISNKQNLDGLFTFLEKLIACSVGLFC